MKNICLLIFILAMCSYNASAQEVVKLWSGNPPTDNKLTEKETIANGGRISNVSDPDITLFPAAKTNNSGLAILICPGGGYARLAFEHEGTDFAKWLNTIGITGVVLKYRMPNTHKTVPLEDAHQAMRYLRSNASKYGINANKIGIAGFSAGGHLAATASTHFVSTDGSNVRPDFSILFYPVITMTEATHGGSRTNLLGDKPSLSDIHLYSNEKQVNSNTPPTLLLLSDDDTTVLPVNSTSYYDALKINNILATLYIFPQGKHGWGMNKNFKYHELMLSLLKDWLEQQKN